VAGWRPAIGWICAAALLLSAIAKLFLPAVVALIAVANGHMTVTACIEALQTLDVQYLMTICTGMLGLSGLRTIEKLKGPKQQ
jgi:putative effector of murein hydrolase LrgA (UPF0299 family)